MSGSATYQASGDRLRFRESLMNLFKPAVLSPKQIEFRKRIRAKGRKHYIFYTGILGWGMSVFLLTTLWTLYDKYGWHVPPRGDLYFYILIGLPVWTVGGYFWGAYMWKMLFEEPTPNGGLDPRSNDKMPD